MLIILELKKNKPSHFKAKSKVLTMNSLTIVATQRIPSMKGWM